MDVNFLEEFHRSSFVPFYEGYDDHTASHLLFNLLHSIYRLDMETAPFDKTDVLQRVRACREDAFDLSDYNTFENMFIELRGLVLGNASNPEPV